jgi:hypothetical protein
MNWKRERNSEEDVKSRNFLTTIRQSLSQHLQNDRGMREQGKLLDVERVESYIVIEDEQLQPRFIETVI